jgi:hypothetical protein
MCRVGIRAGAWALAGTVMITLAAGRSAAGHAAPPGQGPGPQIFTMKLLKDHHPRLDRGVLTYSDLAAMQVRQAASFDVVVTDVGRGPETSAFTRQSRGWLIDPQAVPAGGTVSVQIICSAELTCTPRASSPGQAIRGAGRSATWSWDITARSPGNAQILVTAVSYRGRSRVVASQTSVGTGVKVRSTPLYTLEAAFDARKEAVFVSAAVLAAAMLLGGAVALDRRRGRGRPASRRPGVTAAPQARREPAELPPWAVVPRMRLEPVPPAGAGATLMVWQTPDDGLTCQEPDDDWVRRWTYGVSLGQDAEPRFVLTGDQHGCLPDSEPGLLGDEGPATVTWVR